MATKKGEYGELEEAKIGEGKWNKHYIEKKYSYVETLSIVKDSINITEIYYFYHSL